MEWITIALTILIYIIFIIKMFYVLFTLSQMYLEKVKKNTNPMDFTSIWKRIEFIFTTLMSLLFIIIFNPWYKNIHLINKEIKILFFMFGLISLFTANWNAFVKEAPWYERAINAWK